MVDVEFTNEFFILKALKCLSNFINKECSSKPWNWCDHLTEFIKPKENQSISLKDHRLNRLNDCFLTVIYHLDDIARYLETYSTLDRSFIDMEILKPIFAKSLLGIHILRPFHKLMMVSSMNYSTLLEAYPKLYDELQTVSPKDLLYTNLQWFKFVSSSTSSASLPNGLLLANLKLVSDKYEHEIISLVKISLKLFSDGLHHQKGYSDLAQLHLMKQAITS